MDFDSLEKYWPLIAKYPWAFAWALFTGIALGIALQKTWTALTSTKPKVVTSPAPVARKPQPSQQPFKPSALQIECIRAMRFFDDEWVPLEHLANDVGADTARADVRQALESLTAANWASAQYNYLHGLTYRLKGRGIDFAREQKFPVGKPSDY
jgi:hypothetical protein